MIRAALCVLLLALATIAASQTEDRSYRLEDLLLKAEMIPEPPMQHSPWKPSSTRFSDSFLADVDLTFSAYGLADPRGCEYREIAVLARADLGAVMGYWTQGWVLPESAPDGTRFAICWDGLIYPIIEVGESKDLEASVRQGLIDARAYSESSDLNLLLFDPKMYYWRQFFHIAGSGVGAYLMLRLGEENLAIEILEANSPASSSTFENSDTMFCAVTDGLIASRYIRGLRSHIICDDYLALHDLKKVNELYPRLQAEYKRRSFSSIWGGNGPEFFRYMEDLESVLRDQTRRAQRSGLEKTDDEIAALILQLEDIDPRQMDQPGSVSLCEDIIVQKLILADREAIPYLDNCIATDDRLTRSMWYHRHFFRHGRHVISVREAATTALASIVKVPETMIEDIKCSSPEQRQDIILQLMHAEPRRCMPPAYWPRDNNFSEGNVKLYRLPSIPAKGDVQAATTGHTSD